MRISTFVFFLSLLTAIPQTALAEIDPAVVGSWQNATPDPKNPSVQWVTTLTIASDGHYQLNVLAGGKQASSSAGVCEAHAGKWSSTSDQGAPNGGSYRFERKTLEITYKSGKKMKFQPLSGANGSSGGKQAAVSPTKPAS